MAPTASEDNVKPRLVADCIQLSVVTGMVAMVLSKQFMIALAFQANLCCILLSQLFCEAKVSPSEINEIVNLHNMLRASVSPSASNMETIVSVVN